VKIREDPWLKKKQFSATDEHGSSRIKQQNNRLLCNLHSQLSVTFVVNLTAVQPVMLLEVLSHAACCRKRDSLPRPLQKEVGLWWTKQ